GNDTYSKDSEGDSHQPTFWGFSFPGVQSVQTVGRTGIQWPIRAGLLLGLSLWRSIEMCSEVRFGVGDFRPCSLIIAGNFKRPGNNRTTVGTPGTTSTFAVSFYFGLSRCFHFIRLSRKCFSL